jgi:hypothetical protein
VSHRIQVRISAELFTEILTEGWELSRAVRCIKGLPGGSVCVGVTWDPIYVQAIAVFDHPSFAEVPPGGQAQTLTVEYKERSERLA